METKTTAERIIEIVESLKASKPCKSHMVTGATYIAKTKQPKPKD